MIITLVISAVLAEAAQGQAPGPVDRVDQIVVPVPGATMACTKEGDHLVCVIPLDKTLADEPQRSVDPAPKARAYKPSPPTPALPNPEILTQLKLASANIELAKSLLPKATTTEEVVLAEQLLYWAKEQKRTAEALLHTAQENLHSAPDPFDRQSRDSDAQPMAVCQADISGTCEAGMP